MKYMIFNQIMKNQLKYKLYIEIWFKLVTYWHFVAHLTVESQTRSHARLDILSQHFSLFSCPLDLPYTISAGERGFELGPVSRQFFLRRRRRESTQARGKLERGRRGWRRKRRGRRRRRRERDFARIRSLQKLHRTRNHLGSQTTGWGGGRGGGGMRRGGGGGRRRTRPGWVLCWRAK